MVRAVVDTMNEMGDAVAEERKAKEEDKRDMDERMKKMEVEVAEERKAKEEDKRDMDERMKKMEVEVAEERKAKEEDKRDLEENLKKMEEMVKNNEVRAEADRNEREMERRKESVREMEDRLKVAGRQIKLLDMDFGRVMTNRKEMVDSEAIFFNLIWLKALILKSGTLQLRNFHKNKVKSIPIPIS
jgi:hypothetical protein